MDQKQSNLINKGIGCFLIPVGIFMLFMGITFLSVSERNSTENTIMTLSLVAGLLMLFGAYQNIKRANIKDKALVSYQNEVRKKLSGIQQNSTANATDTSENAETYQPDIVAKWTYTPVEWALMRKLEQKRRFKEGIWVSTLIGLFGGWVLYIYRDVQFGYAFLFSLVVGVIISLIKVAISNSLLANRKNNTIILTTNALIINGKFKTIQDDAIHLEYVKQIEKDEHSFIEFSLQWATSNGVTNDQLQIFIPERFKGDIAKVLEYYKEKGVTVN